jgi:beta-lactamase regulating signal transducer with metallopeptidase domain
MGLLYLLLLLIITFLRRVYKLRIYLKRATFVGYIIVFTTTTAAAAAAATATATATTTTTAAAAAATATATATSVVQTHATHNSSLAHPDVHCNVDKYPKSVLTLAIAECLKKLSRPWHAPAVLRFMSGQATGSAHELKKKRENRFS